MKTKATSICFMMIVWLFGFNVESKFLPVNEILQSEPVGVREFTEKQVENFDTNPGGESNFNDYQIEDQQEKVNNWKSIADEETIRKAERIAQQDLLKGLNDMLQKNETIGDIIRKEGENQVMDYF